VTVYFVVEMLTASSLTRKGRHVQSAAVVRDGARTDCAIVGVGLLNYASFFFFSLLAILYKVGGTHDELTY